VIINGVQYRYWSTALIYYCDNNDDTTAQDDTLLVEAAPTGMYMTATSHHL